MLLPALNPEHIALLSWNIAKGSRQGWRKDLGELVIDKQLVMIQEARLEHAMQKVLGDSSCWAFAPGFRGPSLTTGVLTMSRARTHAAQPHRHREPFTRLPKASLITEYRIDGERTNLLVGNVHAINFTAGTRHFRAQLEALYDAVSHHEGPLLLCGDFNTWRGKRLRILDDLVTALGLDHVALSEDHRRQAFGYALDHLFFRNLRFESADVHKVISSDHNPISATMRLN